jgi:LuxR family maltose regulon positive regulatory protein
VCWALAIGCYFTGRPAEADHWFAEAIAAGEGLATAPALAYRSLIAGEQGRLQDQRRLAEEGMRVARERGVESGGGEVHLAWAASHLARGEAKTARTHAERGVEALRSLRQPTRLAFALIRQAGVLRALGDGAGASAAVAEAQAIVDDCRDPGVLAQWVAASPRRRPSAPAVELSQRERLVLRVLTGPLSERDIGRELYLSHNTVHSHTRSIYRKLGVSSRAEAIARGRALGLV